MQRPFFSQSPKRVGSGPGGPPSSRGGGAAGVPRRLAVGTTGRLGGEETGGTDGGRPGLLLCDVDILI